MNVAIKTKKRHQPKPSISHIKDILLGETQKSIQKKNNFRHVL